MNTQYSEYKTKITDAEDKVTTWEDYYYKKFSAMESALSNINSQQSSLSGYFGKG
jgi:flagellar hook-associated protein 2